MDSIADKLLVKVESLVNQSGSLTTLVDALLNHILPHDQAFAWPCWYEKKYQCEVNSSCSSGWKSYIAKKRYCCYRGGATIGCGEWYSIPNICCPG